MKHSNLVTFNMILLYTYFLLSHITFLLRKNQLPGFVIKRRLIGDVIQQSKCLHKIYQNIFKQVGLGNTFFQYTK